MSPKDASANALIAAHMRPALVKYFKTKCRAADQAEDLAQDVLARALAHATWETPEQAKGYIFRSAVNRWRDQRRRTVTRGVTVQWDEGAAAESTVPFSTDEETVPERVLIVEQELNRVAMALQQLNERTRDVFLLIRLEQMKQAAVAQMLDLSVSTVEKELVKALAHLARCAKRDGTP